MYLSFIFNNNSFSLNHGKTRKRRKRKKEENWGTFSKGKTLAPESLCNACPLYIKKLCCLQSSNPRTTQLRLSQPPSTFSISSLVITWGFSSIPFILIELNVCTTIVWIFNFFCILLNIYSTDVNPKWWELQVKLWISIQMRLFLS